MTRISFDLSPELHQQFKLYCAQRKTTITNEVTDFIKKTLETAESGNKSQTELKIEKEQPQKTVKELDNDFERELNEPIKVSYDEPVKAGFEPAKIEAELKSVVGILTGLVPTVAELVQWREKFRAWQDSKFAGLDVKFGEIDQKFVAMVGEQAKTNKKWLGLAKTLSPMMYIIGRNKVCDDDVEFLGILANEPMGKWTKKEQFEDLLRLLNPQLSIFQ